MLKGRFAFQRVLLFGHRRSNIELAKIFLKDHFPGGVRQVVSSFITGDIFLSAFQQDTGRLPNRLARLISGRKASRCAASSSS